MATIHFFTEDLDFKLPFPRKTTAWIQKAIKKEKRKLSEINFILCSDEYLLAINKEYLNHNTYTDIVTFDNSDDSGFIEGDIFISVERVKENAAKYKRPFEEELRRVLIHGVLHLIGYSDKKISQKAEMREKENTYLATWK